MQCFLYTSYLRIQHEKEQLSLFDCIASEFLEDQNITTDEEMKSSSTSTNEAVSSAAKGMDTSNWFDNLTDEDFELMDNMLT